jgi:hypothetical protein
MLSDRVSKGPLVVLWQGWSFTKSGHDQPSRNGRDRLVTNDLPNLFTRLGLVTGS